MVNDPCIKPPVNPVFDQSQARISRQLNIHSRAIYWETFDQTQTAMILLMHSLVLIKRAPTMTLLYKTSTTLKLI